ANTTNKALPAEAVAPMTEQKKQARDLARIWFKALNAGAKLDSAPNTLFTLADSFCCEPLANKDAAALAVAAQQYGQLIARENTFAEVTYTQTIAPLIKTMEDANDDEATLCSGWRTRFGQRW